MEGKWLMITLVAIASIAVTTAATNHIVGGNTGWTIPTSASFYSQWGSPQTFVVGDTLMFNFTTGAHNVIEVPKSSYDACSVSNQIGSTVQTGPATVTITTPGSHYYICGFPSHCSIGQKLAIIVGPSGKSSLVPAAPPVSGSPMTPMTPSGTTIGPSGGSGPKSSAPSSLISSGYLAISAVLPATAAAFLL